jgi:Uma2 family endonuclease
MAESDSARDYLIYGVEALKAHFQSRTDVYVSGNLWLCYEQGIADAVVAPDVFVIFGVEDRPRRSYKVWEEGKTPDWVLEVTSGTTRRKNEQDKPRIYAQMGVTEYFQYDPTGDYLTPALKGQHLLAGTYQPLLPQRQTARGLTEDILTLPSSVLGLSLCLLPNGQLRFFNPLTQEYLRSPEESERERLQERQEKELQRQRADRLAAKLRELGIDPEAID